MGKIKGNMKKSFLQTGNIFESNCMNYRDCKQCMNYRQGVREGGSGGTSFPGPGLGGPEFKGPGGVQVSALSFSIAP